MTALYRKALEEVDFAVDHAAPDGFIGPDSLRAKDRWPHAVFFRAVLAQYEISGDARYLDALIRHYRSTPHPMGWDRDVTGVEILLNLYQESGQADLLEMAETLYARFNQQWPEHDCAINTLLSDKKQTEHGVTFNEEAKLAAMLYCATGKADYLRAVVHGYAKARPQGPAGGWPAFLLGTHPWARPRATCMKPAISPTTPGRWPTCCRPPATRATPTASNRSSSTPCRDPSPKISTPCSTSPAPTRWSPPAPRTTTCSCAA